MRFVFSISILMIGMVINAQDVLTISGQVYKDANDLWTGVNIPRSVPVKLVFKNNSITSLNTLGYMLQAGDEVAAATNNNLEGEIITGNKFTWNGNDMKCITHGIFTGHNINAVIRYNYLDHVPMGIIRKSGTNMNNTSGGVSYNIVKSPNTGIVVKGMSGVCIFNNTLYQDRNTSETGRGLIDIYSNSDVSPVSVSHGTKIYNNVFYTRYETYCINVIDQESLSGLESDYNVFYCETGTPKFYAGGSIKTFSEWQALGYDIHSVVVNPNFKDFVSFVPTRRLDYGTDLGSGWNTGLSVNAVWGTADPETTAQNGRWQVGARIYDAEVLVPEFTGAIIETATPARLEMIYNLTLANVVPGTTAFKVTVNSSPRSITSVSISGTKVLLILSIPVINGDVVTITYTKPSANALQSASGVLAASITDKPVLNNVESFRPVMVSSTVENSASNIIRMVYDLSLSTINPPASAFTVMVNSVFRSVNKVEISGKEVFLTIAGSIVAGDVITVAYTIPSVNALRSASGWYVLSFSAQPVINNVNSLRPVLVSSSVENSAQNIIELAFNLDLADILPPASAFSVMVNSVPRVVGKVEISGTEAFLTLTSSVVTGDVITVTYTIPPFNALRSVPGWYVLTFGAQPVTNNITGYRPVLLSSSVENSTPGNLKMTFSLNLSTGYIPPPTAFTINVNSILRTVNSVAISGTDVTLTLSSPVVNGDVITVAYTIPSTNALRSVPGWYVLSFGAQPVTNNILNVRPVLLSAVVEFTAPSVLDMTFSLNLSTTYISPASAFTVMVNSVQRTVSSVAISGTKVLLTLASKIVYGDIITVAYTIPSTNALRSVPGWYVLTFSTQPVTNKCLASSVKSQKSVSDNEPGTESLSDPFVEDHNLVISKNLSIYPNPASDFINIFIPEPSSDIQLVKIFDHIGKLCMEIRLEPDVNNLRIPLGLKSGTYILQLVDGNKVMLNKKLIILN